MIKIFQDDVEKTDFAIVSILPFWRYAVVPDTQFTPGIPFYTLRGATEFMNKAMKECPYTTVYLVKRKSFLWQSVFVMAMYQPD